jgi:hypothetical protein
MSQFDTSVKKIIESIFLNATTSPTPTQTARAIAKLEKKLVVG